MSVFGPQISSQRFGGQYYQIGRVKSIVLGPYKGDSREIDPDYGSPFDIGKISYEILYSTINTSKSKNIFPPAFPIFNFVRQYPLVNEIVLIMVGPSEKLNDGADKQQRFYFPPFSVWNKANHGAFPNLAEYSNYLKDFVNEPGYAGTVTPGFSLPLGYSFKENKFVRNLQPFEGDTIVQGRFGQSIRFGSTVKGIRKTGTIRFEDGTETSSRTDLANTWSTSGENGDPITIILNSQDKVNENLAKTNLVENINKDGSAIWMTSTQEIFLEDINNFPLNSFNVPVTPIIQPTLRIQNPPLLNKITSPADQDKSNIK